MKPELSRKLSYRELRRRDLYYAMKYRKLGHQTGIKAVQHEMLATRRKLREGTISLAAPSLSDYFMALAERNE